MQSELRSREALVEWIQFCVLHAATTAEHPILKDYGVALRATDFRQLVLSDRVAIDAALRVFVYVQDCTKPDLAVFSLTNQKVAFEMARRFAERSAPLLKIWEVEQQNAQSRVDRHFKEVQRKQQLARTLRDDIRRAEGSLRQETSDLNDAQQQLAHASYYERSGYQLKVNQCQSSVNSVQTRLNGLRENLKEAEKAPPPVFQPLPDAEPSALSVLFFMHTPKYFRRLAQVLTLNIILTLTLSILSFSLACVMLVSVIQVSCTAQQLMLPHWKGVTSGGVEWDLKSSIGVDSAETSWVSYYNAQQTCQYFRPPRTLEGSDGAVKLFSYRAKPKSWGPGHVDQCSSPSHGIWHPDLDTVMLWRRLDAKPFFFNPFQVASGLWVSESFTERLPKIDDTLQWALLQPGSDLIAPTRGNQALSTQCDKPMWLSKTEYLAYGAMRAFPRLQLRRVCVCFHERSLPLTHPSVHVLLLQTLFHLGDIDQSANLEWKVDMFKGDFLPVIHAELDSLVGELKQSPRLHDSMRILGQVAAFVAAWRPEINKTAQNFANAARDWADGLQEQIDEAEPAAVPEFRLRQSALYLFGILCFGRQRKFSPDDAANLVQLSVLARNTHIVEDESMLDSELASLWVVCENVLAHRVTDVLPLLNDKKLTAAVKLVIMDTPTGLEWKRSTFESGVPTSCFESVSGGSHLYSINVLNGIVLFDGSPPCRLPQTVLDHPLYQRSFDNHNFEIFVSTQKVMRTVRRIHGRFYDFFLSSGDSLIVHESDPSSGIELELLDATKISHWGTDLPPRLQQLHSHWLDASSGAVLFRPVKFKERDVDFILKDDSSDSASRCYRLPFHQRSLPWPDLYRDRSLYDALVLNEYTRTCSRAAEV